LTASAADVGGKQVEQALCGSGGRALTGFLRRTADAARTAAEKLTTS
jgi:hypothetical protein